MKPGKEPPVAPEPQVGHACFRWTSDRTEMNRIDWIFLVFWAETSSLVRSGSRSDSGSGSGSRSGLEPGWPDESWPLALSFSWPTCFWWRTLRLSWFWIVCVRTLTCERIRLYHVVLWQPDPERRRLHHRWSWRQRGRCPDVHSGDTHTHQTIDLH